MNRKVVIAIICGVVAAVVLATVLFLRKPSDNTSVDTSAASPAPESADGSVGPRAEDICTVGPNDAKIRKERYPDYKIERGTNEIIETATLSDGTRVEIRSQGCTDIITTRLTLTAPKGPARSFEEWSRWTDERLQELELAEGGDFLKTEFSDFLSNAAVARAAGETEGADSIRLCSDGTPPEEGADCDWEQGGSVELKINSSGDAVQVILEHKMAG